MILVPPAGGEPLAQALVRVFESVDPFLGAVGALAEPVVVALQVADHVGLLGDCPFVVPEFRTALVSGARACFRESRQWAFGQWGLAVDLVREVDS